MAAIDVWPIETITHVLTNEEADIVDRMKALYYARFHDSYDSYAALKLGLSHSSVLLRHEIAYVMGQMTVMDAVDTLIALVDNVDEHPMVRHEAGEALHAIGCLDEKVFDCCLRHLNDPNQAVRETMELTHIGLTRKQSSGGKVKTVNPLMTGFYVFTTTRPNLQETSTPAYAATKDPAEGIKELESDSNVADLGRILNDTSCSLWDRYVAMFTLRNISTPKAAKALAAGLSERSSALLRHEIAFVLGQMQQPCAVDELIARVEDTEEADMCRHEAALSLGSVGAYIWNDEGRAAHKKAIDCLTRFSADPDPIVAESCLVALHNIEWETGIKTRHKAE